MAVHPLQEFALMVVERPMIIILAIIILTCSGCTSGDQWRQEVEYEVVREQVYDQAPRTQVDQWLTVSGRLSPENLRGLLAARYDSVMARATYEANPRPTNVFIYLFESEADARKGGPGWVAMLEKQPGSGVSIHIDDRVVSETGQ